MADRRILIAEMRSFPEIHGASHLISSHLIRLSSREDTEYTVRIVSSRQALMTPHGSKVGV